MNTNLVKKLLALSLTIATAAPLAHAMESNVTAPGKEETSPLQQRTELFCNIARLTRQIKFAQPGDDVLALKAKLADLNECAMCKEPMDKIEDLVTTPCTHRFHRACLNTWTEINNTCLVCQKSLTTIFGAAKSGDLDAVKAWLATPGIDVNAKDKHGDTPLRIAIRQGHRKVVEFLITNKANKADVNAKDGIGWTPLHFAAIKGHTKIVKVLVKNGADVNAKSNVGSTPLHFAVRCGHRDVVEFLIDKDADVNAKENDGYTPLHWAVKCYHRKIAEFLIDHGADINAQNNDGETPRQLASWAQYFQSYFSLL